MVRLELHRPPARELLAEQSQEADMAKRKQVVWQIERILAEDVARFMLELHTKAA